MEKKKNNLIPIIIILIVLVLGLGGFIVYDKVLKNDKIYTLNVLKSDITYCNSNNDNTCKDIVYTIKTENPNATFVQSDNGFILYDDNGLKIYDTKNKTILKVDLKNDYSEYGFHYKYNEERAKVIGLICQNDTKSTYYNLLTKKKMYENQYDYLYVINENFIQATNKNPITYGIVTFLLNTNKEEIIMNNENSGYSIKYYNDNYYILEYDSFVEASKVNVYTSNKKKIVADASVNKYYFDDNGNLHVVSGNAVKEYNINGNLISTSKDFPNIVGFSDGFVVYLSDNNLYLETLKNNKKKMITTWSSNYYYDEYSSRYYDRETLNLMGENDKAEGFYVVINYKNQDANGNYGIEYCYDVETNELKTYNIKEPVGGRAKPVLYLYPTKTTNVKVSFQYPEYLTTTYPKYNNGWEVLANPNGDLFDKDNKYYYALYWDETRYNEVNFDEGFYVTKENTIDFLEEKLEIIGLNNKERNEFIMYWLPILENNEKSLVYFELTEEREKSNKLIIEPTPDSLLRVSIHIKRVNDYTKIKEQKLTSFERNGFVAVEWGGMTY